MTANCDLIITFARAHLLYFRMPWSKRELHSNDSCPSEISVKISILPTQTKEISWFRAKRKPVARSYFGRFMGRENELQNQCVQHNFVSYMYGKIYRYLFTFYRANVRQHNEWYRTGHDVTQQTSSNEFISLLARSNKCTGVAAVSRPLWKSSSSE